LTIASAKIHATGRRKNSICSMALFESNPGKITINGKDIVDYFGSGHHRHIDICKRPFIITGTDKKYSVVALATGGGITGQAGAFSLAAARALVKADEALKIVLKKAGLLSRDPRVVERKKPGKPKARKRFQFSKR